MVYRKRVAFLLAAAWVAAFLLAMVGWPVQPPPAAAQQPPVVFLEPSQVTAGVASTVTLQVRIQRAINLAAFQLTLAFDPDILDLGGIDLGDFLSLTGRPPTDFPPLVLEPGRVIYQAVSAPGAPGVSGDGLLATLHLTTLAEGSSPVALPEVLLVSAATVETAIEGGGTRVTVGEAPAPGSPILLPIAYTGR